MEISEVQKAKSIGELQKKEGIQQTKVEDNLTISSESEKRAGWVELLKEMPDIRQEKIDAALQSSPSSRELAETMLSSETVFANR